MNKFYTTGKTTCFILAGLLMNTGAYAQETSPVNDPNQIRPAPWRVDLGLTTTSTADSKLPPDPQSGQVPQDVPGNANDPSARRTNDLNPQTNGQTARPTAGQTGAQSVLDPFNHNAGNRRATGDANAMGSSIKNGEASSNPLPGTFAQGRPAGSQEPRSAREITRVVRSVDSLPNDAGQVWREYDISPYTLAVQGSPNPQQALLDWILSETGTEMWFNQPLGILNASRERLYVYHTPEIHAAVKPMIDRFVKTRGQIQNIDINLVTVQNPNWRARAYSMMQPIEVHSPGVEAWMVSKENAAVLLGQLRQRADFRQHSSGRVTAHDGQKVTLEKHEPVQFVRSLRWINGQFPNYQPVMTTVQEGYRLDLSSLSSLDNRTIEAMIHCDVDQVEKLTTVKVPVPYRVGAAAEKMHLQIPQIVSWRLKERFRWPADQVLLLSCGVVANPDPKTGNELGGPLAGISRALSGRNRADALVFIEYRGPANGAELPAVTAQRGMRPVSPRR